MRMERRWKDQLYQEFARIGKCLSSPKRLEIIDLLAQGPKSVDLISKNTGMSVANVSQHLQTLLEARLVQFTKKGNYVIYELADLSVADFMVSLHRLGENQLVEIQRMKRDILELHESMEPIALEVLMDRMERGEVLLIDVRPTAEYEKAHIPGAVSIPIDDLEKHLTSLPDDQDIVAYCRGPYCLMAARAVEIMKEKGLNAFRIEEGVHEWHRFANQEALLEQ